MKHLEIFKAGKHTSMDGRSISFGESDITSSIKAYDPKIHEAPLVIGHPKHDAPAYGWVQSLTGHNGLMQAIPQQVDPEFAEMVEKGRFKKISASFYEPNSPINPVPGVYYLRHVGFLGAQPPAVKGLKSASFAEEAGTFEIELDFAEFTTDKTVDKEEQLEQREQELNRREAALRRQEAANFVEGIKPKILPTYRPGLIEFMCNLDTEQVLEFSEGSEQKKLNSSQWFKEFLTNLPQVVEFKEVGGGKTSEPPTDPKEIAKLATQYVAEQKQKGLSVSYAEAVDHVIQTGG